MTRLGHIVAVLAFAVALLMSAVGGAMAHVDMPAGSMTHHGSPHTSSPSAPSRNDHHKSAVAVAATCCPAAEAPARHAIAVAVTAVRTAWQPGPDYLPDARDITPEPPPPKTVL